MTLVNIVLKEISENQKYRDEDTGATYRVEHTSQSKYKWACFIWKNNRQFMLTPVMRSKKIALTVAATAIAGNVLQ